MRGGPALLGEISPRRDGNFHINALKRAGPPRRASKSKLRIHTTKFVLASIFLDNFSFYKFCMFVYV